MPSAPRLLLSLLHLHFTRITSPFQNTLIPSRELGIDPEQLASYNPIRLLVGRS